MKFLCLCVPSPQLCGIVSFDLSFLSAIDWTHVGSSAGSSMSTIIVPSKYARRVVRQSSIRFACSTIDPLLFPMLLLVVVLLECDTAYATIQRAPSPPCVRFPMNPFPVTNESDSELTHVRWVLGFINHASQSISTIPDRHFSPSIGNVEWSKEVANRPL